MRKWISLFTTLVLSMLCVALPGLAETGAALDESIYLDLLLSVDYGLDTTYVIGHKSPDSDTVGSAMAYAYFLNQIGVPAQAAVSASVNQETAYALKTFGLEAPPIVNNAEGKQFVLVDHSTYTQTIDGMEDARVVGILDHHGIGNVLVGEQISVISEHAGATASLVFRAYRQCGVEIPQDMARVLLMALLSDTLNMSRNVTLLDQLAYDSLLPIAALDSVDALWQGMQEAALNYDGMTDREMIFSDYKEYESGGTNFSIGVVAASDEADMLATADQLNAVLPEVLPETGMDMIFIIVQNRDAESDGDKMCLIYAGGGAEELLQKVFVEEDEEGRFLFEELSSRKQVIAPAIIDALE